MLLQIKVGIVANLGNERFTDVVQVIDRLAVLQCLNDVNDKIVDGGAFLYTTDSLYMLTQLLQTFLTFLRLPF